MWMEGYIPVHDERMWMEGYVPVHDERMWMEGYVIVIRLLHVVLLFSKSIFYP